MRVRQIYTSKTNIYLITCLTSEDETILMMTGAENDANEVPTQGLVKPLSFYPCLCYHFLASLRFLITTEKDRIDVYFSIVDQRIKLIYLAQCISCIDNS